MFKILEVDGIIVIGGGLVLDLVKVVVVLVFYGGVLKIFVLIEGGMDEIMFLIFLIIVILIIFGMGSEVGRVVIVILDDGCKVGLLLFYLILKIVIVDLELIMSLLFMLIVVMGMDVILYCIEIYFVFFFNLFVDGIVLEGLCCFWVNICIVIELFNDKDVCGNMVIVVIMGVMVF